MTDTCASDGRAFQAAASCPDCTQAAAELWHAFTAGCPGCSARMLARGPDFFESRRDGHLTARYQAALQRLALTHQQVKAAAEADHEGQACR